MDIESMIAKKFFKAFHIEKDNQEVIWNERKNTIRKRLDTKRNNVNDDIKKVMASEWNCETVFGDK